MIMILDAQRPGSAAAVRPGAASRAAIGNTCPCGNSARLAIAIAARARARSPAGGGSVGLVVHALGRVAPGKSLRMCAIRGHLRMGAIADAAHAQPTPHPDTARAALARLGPQSGRPIAMCLLPRLAARRPRESQGPGRRKAEPGLRIAKNGPPFTITAGAITKLTLWPADRNCLN